MRKYLIYVSSLLLFLSACVTPKIHNDLITESTVLKSDLIVAEKKLLKLNSKIEMNEVDLISLKGRVFDLQNDSLDNGKSLSVLGFKYNELSDSFDLLTSKSTRFMADKAKETKKLLEQLETTQLELFTKEDQLSKLSNSLDNKKEELEERSKRVVELEAIINKKDSMVTSLKKSITKALIGLDGDGLSIEQRNGKVYISLDEDLLFASGKYIVNSSGRLALEKLANALVFQKDLEILVEGHTDSIPLSGKGLIKDNWDLSVMRATNVVKVLLQNSSLDPLKLTAAGRAEFSPLDSNKSKEGRSANRRIEMILSPNLDDLFKLLEQ
tara:strand:+ start:706 stop:1683 length:978 start_codon:yes stop_codon:yes gene_type:complete